MARAAFAALVCGVLLLAGCGSDDAGDDATDDVSTGEGDEGGGDAGGESSGDAGGDTGDAAFPVTIEHTYGSTTVPERPERVAAVGLMDQDALLALGIVPVATTEWFGEQPGAIWPWAADELEAAGGEAPVVVGDSTDINYEGIAAEDPDLILALYSGVTEEEYERLSEIAPTVGHPAGQVDYGIGWAELTRTTGRAVGMADEAEALIDDVEAQFDAARAEYPAFAEATAVMATPYEGIFVYGPDDPRGQFLTALGFELPDGLADVTGDEFGANLSEERVEMLDVDAIVWLDAAEAEDVGGALYESLPVHTEQREVFLESSDPLGAATSFVTVLSLPLLLEELVPMLADAVEGSAAAS
ncbi:iron-siderophore ABC transporter substrate-binding protein [Phytoactinopolyspora endophytica]|uniref:iron-siderophore ABC transporter substrate-binding protein n=1 Tax=Phytoactinopolyspora endophytica TaxID=1642495 RepID=UPI00197B1E4D|nr:iron-siderophore ABC transporter substrate-binding protein [Phytoactinopolyspora endophytica]